jgi:hypothetical protein
VSQWHIGFQEEGKVDDRLENGMAKRRLPNGGLSTRQNNVIINSHLKPNCADRALSFLPSSLQFPLPLCTLTFNEPNIGCLFFPLFCSHLFFSVVDDQFLNGEAQLVVSGQFVSIYNNSSRIQAILVILV